MSDFTNSSVSTGPLISFVGLVMIDHQVRALPLTHPFVTNDSEIGDRTCLYAAFEAARRLLVRIEQDAARLVASPPPHISRYHRRFPDIRSLVQVSGNNGEAGERMGFQITQRLETGLEGQRFLYLATTDHDRNILLKFSKRYSKDLHEFCASIDHAPELLAFERLPGGWFGVAMEYFPEADRILDSKSLCIAGEKWLEDIDDIVRKFHAEGYVHGDLRPPNFIVNSGRVFLIDFDWGGKEGQATFPRKKLHPILQDGRWNTKISKNDDERVKEYTKLLISETIKEERVR